MSKLKRKQEMQIISRNLKFLLSKTMRERHPYICVWKIQTSNQLTSSSQNSAMTPLTVTVDQSKTFYLRYFKLLYQV